MRCKLKIFLKSIILFILILLFIVIYISNSKITIEFKWYDSSSPDITELDEVQKNILYSKRYWDLVKMNDSNYRGSSRALIQDKLDHLWRPQKGQPGPNDSDRFVPQLVWQMEALNSSFGSKLKEKKILLWDGFHWWARKGWKSPLPLSDVECHHTPNSVKKCTLIDDRKEVGLGSVDAVIMTHDWWHVADTQIPGDVLQFHFILESPFHASGSLKRNRDLLASYYRGSDLITPFGKWVYYDPSVRSRKQDKDYSKGKSKSVAMFVSNCASPNNRLGYVNELKKYIKVDVYGGCGEHHCSRANENECFKMLRKDYYFYLSFENSNCRDYITEKLYNNALESDVVPVVMGAHPEDYQAMAPHKSYISIEDYTSPKELAEYLIHLMRNPSKYNEYFQWKGTGEFISTELFCRLCAMVHYADFIAPPNRTKGFQWGHQEAVKTGICLKRGKWYWTK